MNDSLNPHQPISEEHGTEDTGESPELPPSDAKLDGDVDDTDVVLDSTPSIAESDVLDDDDEEGQPDTPSSDVDDERVQQAKARRDRLGGSVDESITGITEELKDKEQARQTEFERRQISLTEIYRSDLEETRTQYVETQNYQQFVNDVFTRDGKHLKDSTRRIWLVAGAPGSGREITAVRLATDLMRLDPVDRAQSVYLYVDRDRTLQEIAAERNLPAKGVIIFKNEFDNGRLSADALTSRISGIEADLAHRGVFFIFTVSTQPGKFPIDEITGRYSILFTEEPDRTQIFLRLVDKYFRNADFDEPGAEELRAFVEKEPSILVSYRAVELDREFRQPAHRGDPSALIAALRAGKMQSLQAQRAWFEGLENFNYKLYALFVVLFDGLDIAWLDEIYELAVTQLREMGMDGEGQFIDPRRIGQHIMDANLQLRRRGTRIDFIDASYREVVQRQIENHQRMLWALADNFISTIRGISEQYDQVRRHLNRLNRRSDKADTFQQTRRQAIGRDLDNMRRLRDVIAVALAKLGVFHLDRLRQKLNDLARDPNSFVVLTSSVTLADIAVNSEFHPFVLDILSDWTHSGNFDYKWAATVSISRVYEYVARAFDLPDDPQVLLDDSDQRKADARKLLTALGGLLEDLARNHATYAPAVMEQAKDAITHTVVTQLADQLNQLVQEGATQGNIEQQALTLYQAAEPDERIALALAIIPDAEKQVLADVEKAFRRLVDSWSDQIRLSVVNAISYIAITRPSDMIELVERWVSGENNEDPVWQSGYMALNRLFQHTKGLDMVLLEKRGFPLLRTFPTLLRLRRPYLTGLLELLKALTYTDSSQSAQQEQHAEVAALLNQDPLTTALQTTLQWYSKATALLEDEDEDDDPEDDVTLDPRRELIEQRAMRWEEQVYPKLLIAVNYATAEQRDQFRQAIIRDWLTDEHAESERVHRVAHALIARSHVMDGVVIDLPQAPRRGVLIVDTVLDDATRRKAFQLAQTLCTMVPLQIMILGDNRRVYREGGRGAAQSDGFQHFTVADLTGRSSYRRPALIMPLVQPRRADGREAPTPDDTCFIVICTGREISDLPDFFATLPVPTPKQVSRDNIFARQAHEDSPAAAQLWEWADRLCIISSVSQPIPEAARNQVSVVPLDGFGYAYSLVERQIGKLLRRVITPDQMRAEIAPYLRLSTVPSTKSELEPLISNWLTRLESIEYTHPRNDASLTIAWLLLALARESQKGCEDAISIIEAMLARSDAATVKHEHQMGMACARLLFNFFKTNLDQLIQSQHGALLRLLPAFNRAARDYSDLLPIWEVLITWAEDDHWLALLQPTSEANSTESDGNKLFESIGSLNEQNARAARRWLNRYDRLPEFLELFMDIGKPIDEFIALIRAAHTYRVGISAHGALDKRRQKPTKPPLTEPHLSRLLSFIPEVLDRDTPELRVLEWQIEQIKAHRQSISTLGERDVLLQAVRNSNILVQRLRDQLSMRLAGQLPELTGDEVAYGIIIVQSDHKDMVKKARDLARAFVQLRRQRELRTIMLTLHRIGSGDLLQSFRKSLPKADAFISDSQKRLPLIGPALDRYRDEQIAFVIVLSDKAVLDYDDWGEQNSWDDRLWTIRTTRSRWQPLRGEHLDIREDAEEIMAQIANGIKIRMKTI